MRNEEKSRLPAGWSRDIDFAVRIYEQIEQLLKEGLTAREVAVKVGVAQKTVQRSNFYYNRPEKTAQCRWCHHSINKHGTTWYHIDTGSKACARRVAEPR